MGVQNQALSIIQQLEEEMLGTLKGLEKPDTEINIQDVHDLYLDVEKILRIVANITLNSSSKQAINQLRYAGHHLLKREVAVKQQQKQENLVEAHKHCKRSYYDIIDLYVLEMSHTFTVKLNILPNSEEKVKIRAKIHTLIKEMPEARFNNESRKAYYGFVRGKLIEGLKLLNDINLLIDTNTKFSKEILESKESLIGRNQELEESVKNLGKRYDSKLAQLMYWLGWTIPVFTSIAILFQGVVTDYFRSPVVNVEHSFNSQQPAAINIERFPDLNPSKNPVGKK